MIEVLFGESEAASMKDAKNAGWVEGTADEAICLAFKLDIGDITQDICGEYRKELICSLLNQGQGGTNPEMEQELKETDHNEVKQYAHKWVELVEDNSPLRSVINNHVIGVGEDFYDFLIWKNLI